jgi:hypothetical protein
MLWGVASVKADETIVKVPADITSYCHMQFPPIREDTLSWERPVLDSTSGNIIDFYGPCDHDPLGLDEVRSQRRERFGVLYSE